MIHRLRQVIMGILLGSVLAFASLAPPLVQADEAIQTVARLSGVRLTPSSDDKAPGWRLTAEIDFNLSPKLEDAVRRGLPMQFMLEFVLYEPRWYWADKTVVKGRYPMVLSYHALTQTYRLVTPEGTQTLSDLYEAMREMRRVSDWLVIPQSKVSSGRNYSAAVRFKLDVTDLPKPFQVNALTNSDWELSSDWLEFGFSPGTEGPR